MTKTLGGNVKAATLALAIMLAGCATTDRLISDGARRTYQSDKPVAQVAACVARNAERRDPGVFTTERLLPDGEGKEVLVRWSSLLAVRTMFAIHVVEGAKGSDVTVIQFSDGFGGKERADELMAGC